VTRRRSQPATTRLETCAKGTQPPESRLGSYTVIAPLARGGTAGVYLAEHLETKERVALKVLDPFYCENPDVVARLLAERTVSERARHNGLLDVLVSDKSPTGVPYLVMEYLDGENLGALADRGRMALDAVMAVVAQIASALSALHAAGVVHCDVKPDNVFLLYEENQRGWPRVKVIDYGVARFTTESADEAGIAGTPCYMSPEQWRGAPTPKSDVYSLGCLMYELVTGDSPFHGTLPQLMLAHTEWLAERPSAVRSDLPDDLERLIVRCLAKDPTMRPSMNDVEIALARLLSETANQISVSLAVG
jgi:eukaryotic-like serine/threonine-protein kinase